MPAFRIAALIAEQGCQAGRGVAMPRLNLKRSPKCGFRRFFFALPRLGHPQVGQGVGILGTQRDGPLKFGQRFRVSPECEQCGAIVIAVDRFIGHPR